MVRTSRASETRDVSEVVVVMALSYPCKLFRRKQETAEAAGVEPEQPLAYPYIDVNRFSSKCCQAPLQEQPLTLSD